MFSPGTMQVPLEALISNSSMPSVEVSLPFAHIFQAPSCVLGLSIALLALHLASFFFKFLPWKGPFLRKLTRLDALPEEKEENKVPVWKHVVMTLLAIALAAGHCVCAGYGAAFSSSRKDSLAHFATSGVYFLAAFTLIAKPPKTPEPALLSFYGWQWLVSSSALFRWSDDRYALMCATSVEWLVLTHLLAFFMTLPLQQYRPKVCARDGTSPSFAETSPEDTATLWSFVTCGYVYPLLSAATDHTLKDDECWNLSPTTWHRHITTAVKSIQASSLLKHYLLANSFDIAIHIVLKLVESVVNFAQPVLLKHILSRFSEADTQGDGASGRDLRGIFYLVFLSLLLGIAEAVIELFESWHIRRAYERNRGALMCSVVDKALRRKMVEDTSGLEAASGEEKEHQRANIGQVLNLVQGDAYAFSQWIWDGIGRAVAAPIQVLLAVLTLYYIVGPSTFASLLACLIVALPLVPLSRYQLKVSRQHLEAKDFRVDLVTELVESIRLLKSFAWEWRWLEKTKDARQVELRYRLRSTLADALTNLVTLFMPAAMLLAIFFALTRVAGQSLTVPVAFACLAMVAKLSPPLLRLPDAWIYFLRTLVVVRRLEGLFGEEDRLQPAKTSKTQEGRWSLIPESTVFAWPTSRRGGQLEPDSFILACPTLSLPERGLVLLTGPSSSGKSFFLQSLLGESQIVTGDVRCPDAPKPYSLCPQLPWLESKTIQDNILFHEPLDPTRYAEVVKACALTRDLQALAHGDQTEIGERGISLSGGQRMRVSLARALYSKSPLVLLDDPLAALDSTTCRHVFFHAVMRLASNERLVIMSTHQTSLCLPYARASISLSDNTAKILEHNPSPLPENTQETPEALPSGVPSLASAAGQKFMTDETRAEGDVKLTVYRTYLESAGWWLWFVLLGLLVGARGIQLATDVVLKWWGEEPQARDWLAIFFAFSVLSIFTQFFRVLANLWASYRAANSLFDRCLRHVTSASQRWFDVTPVGRVLNRLVADTSTADSTISSSIRSFLETGLVFASSIAVIMALLPSFLPVAVALQLFYLAIGRGYRRASADLRRLENKYRSPMFTLIGECFAGLHVVRAFGKTGVYLNEMYQSCDRYQAYDHVYWLAVFWLRFRFDTLGRLVIAILTAGCAIFGIAQGWSAFAIVQAEAFVQALHAVVWSAAQLQLDLNAVERIEELLHLEPEEPANERKRSPPAYWPSSAGADGIDITGLEFKYATELPPVVRGLNLRIPPQSKTAIVGRTGSGKSTLASSLLRVREPSTGTITIDGLDITKLYLSDLRSRLSVVPQEPTLFMGSVRFNIDPLNEHSDEECRHALSLMGVTRSLQDLVASGGKNFSAGERNLIALARALLRASNVLILDESTANLDSETDQKIQEMLKEEFKDRIVISIAHRVSTIIDFDAVIVMDEGKIVQQGVPRRLLSQDGPFRELCQASGDMEKLLAK